MLTTQGYVEIVSELKTLADKVGCWLALGGGGYNVDVVPRAWTLAYGVMCGHRFSNELPPDYVQRYGPGHLHDIQGPALTEEMINTTRAYAEDSIKDLSKNVQDKWDLELHREHWPSEEP